MTYSIFICPDIEVMLPDIMDSCTSSVGKTAFITNKENMTPLPVATHSKAWIYGGLLAGIVGSDATGGVDVCLL
jgi:hypothetical protein